MKQFASYRFLLYRISCSELRFPGRNKWLRDQEWTSGFISKLSFYKQGFEFLTFLSILYVVKQWCYCQWSPLMRSRFPAVGKIFNFVLGGLYLDGFADSVGRATWEACSVTWNLATNSEFALGPGKTTENVRWLAGRRTFRILITYFCLASSSALEYTKSNVSTYMCSCLVWNTYRFIYFVSLPLFYSCHVL